MNYTQLRKKLLTIDKNTPIYVAGHLIPDQDSICSCLALAEFLDKHNKNVKVLLKDEDKDIIAWHKNTKFLTNNVCDKNYVFISLDINQKNRLGIYEQNFDSAKITFNIDHHENNKNEANYILADENMSSTCEMIYKLISYDKSNLTFDTCEYLYSGILNDTNCFARRLTNQTLKIAQDLINRKIDYVYIIKKTFATRSLDLLKAQAEIINNLQYKNFYYAVINKQSEIFKDLSYNQIFKQIAEEIRKVENIDNLVFLVQDGNIVKAKVMTNTTDNASKICELFGGGGHKREAGFTIEKPIEEIIKIISDFIKKNS